MARYSSSDNIKQRDMVRYKVPWTSHVTWYVIDKWSAFCMLRISHINNVPQYKVWWTISIWVHSLELIWHTHEATLKGSASS